MITEKRVFLRAKAHLIEKMSCYEGIQIVTDIFDADHVWACNKTPAMMDEFFKEYPYSQLPILDVPEELRDEKDFRDFCYGNGFECGERIQGQKFDTRKDECFLCRIGKHDGVTKEFNRTVKRVSDLIIYESKNFFIKIELGCLIPGMIMINPKKHYYSMARLPEELFDEYFEVMNDAETLLKATYGEEETVIFFEHGSAPTGFSSHAKSIVHAHTHVAIGCKFPDKYLHAVQLRPVHDIRTLYKSKYMSYQEGTDGVLMAVNDPEVYVQRQYPRQVIGLLNGIPNELTNWRVEPFMNNIIKTFNDIYATLTKEGTNVSERIRVRTSGFVEGYPIRKSFSEN